MHQLDRELIRIESRLPQSSQGFGSAGGHPTIASRPMATQLGPNPDAGISEAAADGRVRRVAWAQNPPLL